MRGKLTLRARSDSAAYRLVSLMLGAGLALKMGDKNALTWDFRFRTERAATAICNEGVSSEKPWRHDQR